MPVPALCHQHRHHSVPVCTPFFVVQCTSLKQQRKSFGIGAQLFFILDTDATEVQFCGQQQQQQQLKLSLSGAAGRLHAREAIILIGSYLPSLTCWLCRLCLTTDCVCALCLHDKSSLSLSLYLYLSALSHSSVLTRTN